jgi:predicted lipase
VRKDTATTKYDEITSKLAHYLNLIGEDTTVTVTGHSLGAALATVFSFYASTEERFTRNGAIETVTFGAPFVGGFKFAEAVRHQEDTGKL